MMSQQPFFTFIYSQLFV